MGFVANTTVGQQGQVQAGQVRGARTETRAGLLPSPGVGFQDVWTLPGNFQWPQTAEIISFVSDDANDTLLGTGARTVLVEGLLDDFSEAREFVELNGLTPVNTVNAYRRVNRCIVGATGNYYGTNIGTILGTRSGPVNWLRIAPGSGGAVYSHYTVPADTVCIGIEFELYSQADFVAQINIREDAAAVASPKALFRAVDFFGAAGSDFHVRVGLTFNERTDFWIKVQTTPSKSIASLMNFTLLDKAFSRAELAP